jgi:hypothetical protein
MTDMQKDMTDKQNTDKKLKILKDLVCIAERVKNSIQGNFKDRNMQWISDDELDNYFVYQFLRKAISHARSVILLAEHQFPKEVALITRDILEGWFYLKSFINVKSRATKHLTKKSDKPLAKKWRDFWIYELFQDILKNKGEVEAIEMLTYLEDTMGVNVVADAIREFPLYKEETERSKWYKRGNLKNLIEVDGDTTLEAFYTGLYSLYSKIHHWNPLLMTTELPPELEFGLIMVIFSVFNMAKYANTEYNLKFDNELANIERRAKELQTSQNESLETEFGISQLRSL